LFNSPFIIKLQELGQKVGSSKFLGALQASMMSLLGVIMVGAISQILTNAGTALGWFTAADSIYTILAFPNQVTMNMISLWVAGLVAYNYARNLELKSPIIVTVASMAAFLLASGNIDTYILSSTVTAAEDVTTLSGISAVDMTNMNATGMFVGYVVAFFVVRIYKLCMDKGIYIRMGDAVPQNLQDGFADVVPLLANMALFTAVNVACTTFFGMNLSVAITTLLRTPLTALVSLPGMFVIAILCLTFWCFGIHGSSIVAPILVPANLQALQANADLVATGAAPIFYPVMLRGYMACCGGTGNVLPLSLMALRGKSEQCRAVGKASVIPAWFSINEPATFGFPIMYNPILCIPYILNVPIVMLLTTIAFKVGILTPGFIPMFATLPMGFGDYFTSLSVVNFIWDYLMIIPVGLVYYPFFKIYDKQCYEKEQELKAHEEAQSAGNAVLAA
jgi:PTS system cellobiose-specific IIC component